MGETGKGADGGMCEGLMTDEMDRFRSYLATDAALQRHLSSIEDAGSFAAAVTGHAAALGIALAQADVEIRLRPDPLALDRFDGRPATGREWPRGDWLPGAVASCGDALAVDWVHFGDAPLAEPFFEESLQRARRRPINRLLRHRTPLADLAAGGTDEVSDAPDGLIFHMSRCGSTLTAQMLAAMEGVVISEAAPLDAAVQIAHGRGHVPIEERAALLRAMVRALGRGRAGKGRAYILKLDSWHSLALPLFHAAFPDTPWLFLYRDPVEVLVSHRRMRGFQTIAGAMADLYGIDGGEHMVPEIYVAHVLACICRAALEHRALGRALFLNYRDLPGAIGSRVLPHFGLVAGPEASHAMAEASRRNAKSPGLPFDRDEASKRSEAGPAVRAAAETILRPIHDRLEAIAASGAVAPTPA